MLKINRGYQSLFEYLAARSFPFARWFDRALYPEENYRLRHAPYRQYYNRRWNPKPFSGEQAVGALQPIANIGKDFIDTFKPYKSSYYFIRDLLQPVRGLGNLVRGVLNIVGAPLVWLGDLVRFAFISDSVNSYFKNVAMSGYKGLSWMLDGLSSLVRGNIQIAATSLNLLIRMPIRMALSLINRNPLVEQNEGMTRLMTEGLSAVETKDVMSLDNTCFELHRKFLKAIYRGQVTRLLEEGEGKSFNDYRTQNEIQYGADSTPLPTPDNKAVIAGLRYLSLFASPDLNRKQYDALNRLANGFGMDSLRPTNSETVRVITIPSITRTS